MWRTDQGHVLRHCYPGPFLQFWVQLNRPRSKSQDEHMAESAGEHGILSIATQQELQTGASSLGTSERTKGELKIAFNPL